MNVANPKIQRNELINSSEKPFFPPNLRNPLPLAIFRKRLLALTQGNTQVILISANYGNDKKAITTGAAHLIQKPIVPEERLKVVRDCLATKTMLN